VKVSLAWRNPFAVSRACDGAGPWGGEKGPEGRAVRPFNVILLAVPQTACCDTGLASFASWSCTSPTFLYSGQRPRRPSGDTRLPAAPRAAPPQRIVGPSSGRRSLGKSEAGTNDTTAARARRKERSMIRNVIHEVWAGWSLLVWGGWAPPCDGDRGRAVPAFAGTQGEGR
jgi:hypothetical protein